MFKTYCFSDSQIQRTSTWLPAGRGKGVVQELVSSRDKLLEARWVQGSAVQYEEHSQYFIITVNGKWSLKIVLKVRKKKNLLLLSFMTFSQVLLYNIYLVYKKSSHFKVSAYFAWRRQIFWEQFSLPWGESDGSLEVRDRWIERSTVLMRTVWQWAELGKKLVDFFGCYQVCCK